MLAHDGDSVILFCENCKKETRLFVGPEQDRDYYYCANCGVLIEDELAIGKKLEEYTKLARLIDIGEKNYTY
ncbi:MAG: hypothetical protein AABW46_02830 [Nanoarchaeota archaeon]